MIGIAVSRETRVEELQEALRGVADFPDEEFSAIVRDLGFACDCCGRCCTSEYNGHVFLLDADAVQIRMLDPAALVPAPDFDFCDQNGRFYVAGFALRTNPDGSCIFLTGGRCRIYPGRPAICRVYPYMLHREPDERGSVDWRQISGLNEHGCYHTEIDDAECRRIVRETKEYETAFIRQEIAFLELVGTHFAGHGLRHVRRTYDLQMQRLRRGGEVEVCVFSAGSFEPVRVTAADYPFLRSAPGKPPGHRERSDRDML
ncbi:YkgJ family cysteine cluster protein [Methanoculleus frigidifontis]|uniref:YkgJ family cysteine cluster protein n=1 Tax=Methanoculleus frigidifontis TaxID=2584085 RepID=UPI00265B1185|nr:YkgJ family cysteine cluster protein [Methanoculleus sp. FWC-SCC1]